MTLTIELSPAIEERLVREGHRYGMDATEYARQLIERNLPGARELALADLMQAWIQEDASDDPEVLEAREAELQEFKAGMNANRAAAGERPIYG